MDKILVLYSSRDGQTRKIVDVMLEEISGCEVVMQDLHTLPMCNLYYWLVPVSEMGRL